MQKMSRNSFIGNFGFAGIAVAAACMPTSAWAVDSYRWFHVTVDTPWAIFIFLLPMVVAPLVLMIVIYWRFALRPGDKNAGRGSRAAKGVDPSAK